MERSPRFSWRAGDCPWADHASTVNRLFQANYERLVGTGCFAQCQLPIAIYPDSAPEPDVSVVRGRPQDYAGHLPNPNHVLAVFEVADGSLRLDRTNKLRLSANAGIPSYLVINLVSRTIEFCTKPVIGEGKYAETQMLGVDDSIRLELQDGRCVELAVSEVL